MLSLPSGGTNSLVILFFSLRKVLSMAFTISKLSCELGKNHHVFYTSRANNCRIVPLSWSILCRTLSFSFLQGFSILIIFVDNSLVWHGYIFRKRDLKFSVLFFLKRDKKNQFSHVLMFYTMAISEFIKMMSFFFVLITRSFIKHLILIHPNKIISLKGI